MGKGVNKKTKSKPNTKKGRSSEAYCSSCGTRRRGKNHDEGFHHKGVTPRRKGAK